jgi:hypothetical protein
MTPIRTWHAAALGLAIVSLGRTAHAQVEPIRLEYSAAPECPSAADFARGVLSRTARARLAREAEASARTFVVALGKSGSGFAGNLVVREADGTTSAREVTGADCATVAEALALATSLAIDPNASLEPKPEPGGTPNAPATPPPVAKPPPTGSSPGSPDDGTAAPGAWAARAALGPRVATGIGPELALGGSVSVAWAARRPNRALSSLGVELTALGTLTETIDTASSRFWFTFARPELCSFGVVITRSLALVPCFGLELGAVTGAGSEIPEASTRTRFWAALDAELVLRIDVSERWFVEASGGVVVPLVRYEFVFRDPDTSVHTIPALGSVFGLKVGTRLP